MWDRNVVTQESLILVSSRELVQIFALGRGSSSLWDQSALEEPNYFCYNATSKYCWVGDRFPAYLLLMVKSLEIKVAKSISAGTTNKRITHTRTPTHTHTLWPINRSSRMSQKPYQKGPISFSIFSVLYRLSRCYVVSGKVMDWSTCSWLHLNMTPKGGL